MKYFNIIFKLNTDHILTNKLKINVILKNFCFNKNICLKSIKKMEN
jgi:hypothetical protein